MASRKIENPGVEINEFDRSQYGKVDYSLPNSPTGLIAGFSDKGEDLVLEWINSKSTLDNTYGLPTNEYETYFYNGIHEFLNRGGTCIAARLPYDNGSFNKYNYVELSVSGLKRTDEKKDSSITGRYDTIRDIHDTLYDYLVAVQHQDKDISNISKMLHVCEDEYNERLGQDDDANFNTLRDVRNRLEELIKSFGKFDTFAALFFNDDDLTSYLEIGNVDLSSYRGKDSIDSLDEYLTNSRKVHRNKIRIYDITRSQYQKLNHYDGCVQTLSNYSNPDLSSSTHTNECLGIVPIVTTAANAMFFQQLLDFSAVKASDVAPYEAFNQVSGFNTLSIAPDDTTLSIARSFAEISAHTSLQMASLPDNTIGVDGSNYDSVSRRAAQAFPLITFKDSSHFDKTYLKQVGVCVFKAFVDYDNNGKMGFQLLESFVGSFDNKARDPVTKANIFIDDVINSRSQYIKFFSNVDSYNYERAAILATSCQEAISLGFYDVDCKKKISYQKSIMKPLTYLFDQASNRNTLPLDLVVDAGMSNIAQLAVLKGGSIDVEQFPYVADIEWKFGTTTTDITGWRAVLNKYDNFCKSMRKDCMFLADGIRAMCLDGNVKYIRKTSPSTTVANTIIPKFKYMAGVLNSSYSAGYCNWFYQQDAANEDYFWCPPSIKAAGVYIYCDTYFHPWSAPAGMTRGVLNDVVDVAFVPLDQDAGQIYSNQWNYAMSYPIEGIVIEGHKTFQREKTALDRVNVRRLMLSLEKRIGRIAQRFVYEGNTPYLRQSFVDACRPVLEDAVRGDGVRDYAIKCDDELNTPEVIENNELRCRIAVRPVKVVDYIILDFIVSKQSANVSEEVLR